MDDTKIHKSNGDDIPGYYWTTSQNYIKLFLLASPQQKSRLLLNHRHKLDYKQLICYRHIPIKDIRYPKPFSHIIKGACETIAATPLSCILTVPVPRLGKRGGRR